MPTFQDDDRGYLAWLTRNPNGFVVNTLNPPNRRYLKLHRADCYTINGTPPNGTTWTAGQYIKICERVREELAHWARQTLRSRLSPCGHCFRRS
jgi:hypothetical protein